MVMILLSTSFPALDMRPGNYFRLELSTLPGFIPTERSPDISWFFELIQVLVVVLLILLPVYIALSLLSKEGRRKLLANAILITLILSGALWLATVDLSPASPPASENLPQTVDEAMPFPVFSAEPASWIWPIAILTTAVLLTLGVLLAKSFLTEHISTESPNLIEAADSAMTATLDIEESSIGFDDVIIRCYVEMTLILQAQEGIQRSQGMTAYEFEQKLINQGFPPRPIKQITQLFEQVRYGRHHAKDHEQKDAVECLGEIIDFCRGLS